MPTPPSGPTFSERLWSSEVAIADAGTILPERDVAYRMTNGREFERRRPTYDFTPDDPPGPPDPPTP